MNNNIESIRDEEVELDLKQMFFCILRKWRAILIGMVVIGILAAGVKLGLGMLTLNDEAETQKKVQEYEAQVANNAKLQEESREKLEKLSEQIDEQRSYIDDSIYMKIDPYAVNRAEVRYYVKTDYTIMPSMTYQNVDRTGLVVNTYVTLLKNKDFLTELAEQFGVELRYVQELISISNAGDGMLAINVMADSESRMQQILDYLQKGIDENTDMIQSTITEFTISEICSSIYQTIETDTRDAQQTQRDRLEELMNDYTEEENLYNEYAKPVVMEGDVTIRSVIKGAVKYGIIGVILGAVLVCGWSVIVFIFGNTLYSANALKDRTRLSIIGSCLIQPDKKYNRLDQCLRKCEERSSCKDMTTGTQLTAAYIKNLIACGGSVLITGQAPEETISKLTKELVAILKEFKVVDGGHLLSNPAAVSECSKVDGIVLVEQCGLSKYSDITKELEITQKFGTNVIGCFVLED
jgi:hypothetical protein